MVNSVLQILAMKECLTVIQNNITNQAWTVEEYVISYGYVV